MFFKSSRKIPSNFIYFVIDKTAIKNEPAYAFHPKNIFGIISFSFFVFLSSQASSFEHISALFHTLSSYLC